MDQVSVKNVGAPSCSNAGQGKEEKKTRKPEKIIRTAYAGVEKDPPRSDFSPQTAR